MPTRLDSVVVDAADPSALARFWATATGWPVTSTEPDEVVVEPPEDDAGRRTEPGLPLVFGRVDDPKVGKNRVHLDLDSTLAPSTRPSWSSGCGGRGRRRSTSGRGRCRGWCWPTPRATSSASSSRADDVRRGRGGRRHRRGHARPRSAGAVLGGGVGLGRERRATTASALRHARRAGPWLELLRSDDPKVVKNRVHLDVAPVARPTTRPPRSSACRPSAPPTPTWARASRRGWCWPTRTAASSASSAPAIDASDRNLTVCQICPRRGERAMATPVIPRIISVDDHVVEPPHVWDAWLPARVPRPGPQGRAPRRRRHAPRRRRPLRAGLRRRRPREGRLLGVRGPRLRAQAPRRRGRLRARRDDDDADDLRGDAAGLLRPPRPASRTTSSTTSRRRCASRRSPGSAGRPSPRPRTTSSGWPACGPTTTGWSRSGAATRAAG